MKVKQYIFMMLCALAVSSCGESLEDTYADMAGDGEIRYIGKCKDMTVAPGWQRLIVKWNNNVDRIIDKVKVTWKNGDVKDSVMLERGTTEYSIPNLEDANYEVTICSVDKSGNESLGTTLFGRPYTENHEEVRSFTRLVSSHYFFNDRLILKFIGWDNNIETARLAYTKSNGQEGSLDLTPEIVGQMNYLLPDKIDPSKPVRLYRTGRLVGCEDLIEFSPYDLENEKIYSADFKQEMKRQFGYDGTVPESWARSVETLSLDRSISSLDDLFYLPNLKKLVLGKNRILTADGINDEERGQSKFYEPDNANFAVETLHELTGLEVEVYNEHYKSLPDAPYIHRFGAPAEPQLDMISLKNAKWSVSPADDEGYNSHLEYLFDSNPNSSWDPFIQDQSTNYEITLDLQEMKTIHGMRFVQSYFDSFAADNINLLPTTIRIKLSENQLVWRDATYTEEVALGNSTGEINIIPFAGGSQQARYVRIMVTTNYFHGKYDISFAEVGLY